MISKYYKVFKILLSAILMGLAQHPLGLGFLSYIALLPLLSILSKLRCYRQAAKIGLLWGLFYNLTVVYWLAFNIGTSQSIAFFTMILSVIILSSCSIITFIIWCSLNRRGCSLILFPAVWASIEYLRGFGTLGFPWTSIANTQLEYHLLIQNAEYTGMYVISFWIVLLNISIYKLISDRNTESLAKCLAIFMFPILSGYAIISSHSENTDTSIRVLSIQPNIHLSEKWSRGSQNRVVTKIINQTTTYLDSSVDLIIWPETSTTSHVLQNDKYNYNRIVDMLQNSKASLIAGIPFYERKKENIEHYNSVGYFNKEGVIDYYHKIRLVPGAEYVPLSDFISSMSYFNFGLGNFSHGNDFKLFDINNNKFASLICMESIFPSLSRKFTAEGANFLVYVVNDGWYETAPEPQQHSSRVIYRAIETRKPVIRCANTGISMVIDQFGNIQHHIDLNKEGSIVANIYPNSYKTFYVRYGDIFIYLMIVGIILSMFKSIKYEDYV